GLTAFPGNHQRINDALKCVGNAKRHPDNRNQGGGKNHAIDQGNSARIWRKLRPQEIAQPDQYGVVSGYQERESRHDQRPRMVTTADSPKRKRPLVGFSTRRRTGYRDAKCTQFSVRRTSGRPEPKWPIRSGSGVTPNPTLSTIAEKRKFGLDIT